MGGAEIIIFCLYCLVHVYVCIFLASLPPLPLCLCLCVCVEVLDRVQQRMEWTQYQERQRRKVEAKEEKERGQNPTEMLITHFDFVDSPPILLLPLPPPPPSSPSLSPSLSPFLSLPPPPSCHLSSSLSFLPVEYSQVDWHEFVLVETITFRENETGIFIHIHVYVALPCCLFDLACFLLPSFSHLSCIIMYIVHYTGMYIHVCMDVLLCDSRCAVVWFAGYLPPPIRPTQLAQRLLQQQKYERLADEGSCL